MDLFAAESTRARLSLDPRFEYGFMALEGLASINGHELTEDNMVILEPGLQHVDVEIHAGGRVLLIGGEPFESPILLWWNLVGRDVEELKLAREQWMMGHPRFGTIPSYDAHVWKHLHFRNICELPNNFLHNYKNKGSVWPESQLPKYRA